MHPDPPMRLLGTAALLFLLVSCAGAPDDPPASERLDADFTPPKWLADTPSPYTDAQLTETNKYGLTIWRALSNDEGDPKRFRGAVAAMHRAFELNDEPRFKADCAMTLATFYESMFNDEVRAFQWYRTLKGLAADVPQVHDFQNHNPRDTVRFASLGMARCCAQVGLKDRAREILKPHAFNDWRELLDLAIIERMLGDDERSDADVERAIAAGRRNLWDRVAAQGRGIILLYEHGRADLVKKHLDAYFADHERLVKQNGGNPLPVNLAGQHRRILAIREAPGRPSGPIPKTLKDGTFSGEAAGMHGPVEVSVTVNGSRLKDVHVKRAGEKRSFNATLAVPRRMVEKQSTRVDAVTGATVTSLAVEEAVRDALHKAEP